MDANTMISTFFNERLSTKCRKFASSVTVWLLAIAIVSAIAMFKSSDEPVVDFLHGTAVAYSLNQWHTGNVIIFNLSMGYLVSFLFWLIVVKIPESRRRKILKNNLAMRYKWFKEDVTKILLQASDSDINDAEKLCDYKEFKKHFNANRKANWYKVLNGLEDNDALVNEIILEMEILSHEVRYVLNNVEIDDVEVFEFFKRLIYRVHRLKNSQYFYEDRIKYLGNFIWEVLARWDIGAGQMKDDAIEAMIDQL